MSTTNMYKYVHGETYTASKIAQPIAGTGFVDIVGSDGITPIAYTAIKLFDDAVGTTELVIDVDFEVGSADARYTALEASTVYRQVRILNASYQSAVFYADFDSVGGYVRPVNKYVGEFFYLQFYQEISANFPNLLLTSADQTLSATNYPDYVWRLRNQAVRVGSTTAFTGTAAASVITLADNADNNALLAALAEDTLFHGGYTNWRTITWGGSDYAITNVNATARTITVTGTPTAGAGSATLYSYRIAGSTTTARLHKADGLVLATAGASGRVAGLRTRDAIQNHWHIERVGPNATPSNDGNPLNYRAGWDSASQAVNYSPGTQNNIKSVTDTYTDGVTAIRSGANTKDRSLAGYLYVHTGRYIAP